MNTNKRSSAEFCPHGFFFLPQECKNALDYRHVFELHENARVLHVFLLIFLP